MKIKVRQTYKHDWIGYEITNSNSTFWNMFYPDIMEQSTFDAMIRSAIQLATGTYNDQAIPTKPKPDLSL